MKYLNKLVYENFNPSLKSILFVSNKEIDFIKPHIRKEFKNIYNFLFISEKKFYYLFDKDFVNIPLIIFDNQNNNLKKLYDIFEYVGVSVDKIPIILIEHHLDYEYNLYKLLNIYSILEPNFDEKILFLHIELCLNFTNAYEEIVINSDYYFIKNENALYKNNEKVSLTKTEAEILRMLLTNTKKIVSYQEIEETVWKGKNFTRYTLRNSINNIRKKTEPFFIKNKQDEGYYINI